MTDNNKFWTSIAALIICILGALLVRNCVDNHKNYKYNKVLKEHKLDTLALEDSVRVFIKDMNISHPDIVYAQAVLESGNFTSDLFISNKNIYGMKEPMVRNTVALGTRNGYAYYKNWQHSVIDYALYQASFYTNEKGRTISRQSYLEKLARTYASDPNYINKLTKIINNNLYE